jgi:hypothetical protein
LVLGHKLYGFFPKQLFQWVSRSWQSAAAQTGQNYSSGMEE